MGNYSKGAIIKLSIAKKHSEGIIMKKIILALIFLSPVANASNSEICDLYYKNLSHYIDIMDTYDNSSSELNKLRSSLVKSQSSLQEISNKDKDHLCKASNDNVVKLIKKYQWSY